MRSWRLSNLPGEIHIHPRMRAPAGGAPLTPSDAASRVRGWMVQHPSVMLDLHETIAVSLTRHFRGTRAERDAMIVGALENAFARGELVAIPIAFVAAGLMIEKIEAPSLGPSQTTSEEAPKDFFEATLKDANGKPAADVKYKLRTPDGQWREGKTDGSGKIRVDDIDRGYCELSFHP